MEEDIIEKLADNEHNRWSNWQKYVHSKCIKNQDGSLTIPKEYVEHWEYEINTKYKDLSENIKESDRKEVRQILEMLDFDYLIARYKKLEEENKELKSDNYELNNRINDLLDLDTQKDKLIDWLVEEIHSIVNLGEFIDNNINKLETKGEIKKYFEERCK